MAVKVHYVKKCRVDNAAVKRGEPYYWWKLPYGEKTASATYPTRSQLTASDYLGCVFDLQDSLDEFVIEDSEDFETMLEEVTEAIGDILEQCETNLANMTPNLHAAPNGRLLIARIAILNEVLDSLDGLDFSECCDEGYDESVMTDHLKKLEVTRKGKAIQAYEVAQ